MPIPPPPMVTYLREPGGPVHLRASRSIQTLCRQTPGADWEVIKSDRETLCEACHRRLTTFIYNIMRDGGENPPEAHEPSHNE